ncbi:MAG TPA: hypothetical protein VL120_10495 [Solirubrobacteraceae bacterium]|jgi:hypothetical protein|nr:hypothetical protein [Solirubrobacteraceae bacterium]
MSKPRAKKKQRQRARAARPATAPAGTAPPRAERAQERAEPAPRHPSRLDVRDGIARPDAIWAPFPLTEIGMGVGLVLFGVGFASGGSKGAWLLVIAVVLLSIVVAELCLREHFGGFRSHSILLGLLPVTAVHMLIVLVVTSDWRGPVVLAVDLGLAGGLAWVLRGRFATAQERARRRAAG